MLQIDKEQIRLNSFMEERVFAKTSYDQAMKQKGLLAIAKNTKFNDELLNFTFSDYSFTDVKSIKEENKENATVFYCGKNVLSKDAKTYYELIQNPGFEDYGFAICTMLTQAAKEDISVPSIGAGGIFIEINSKETKILFLPQDLFINSAYTFKDEVRTNLHSRWINPSLTGFYALCFQRSVIAYHLMTNSTPYWSDSFEDQTIDFLDRNFIPMEYKTKKPIPELNYAINNGLKLNSDYVNSLGQKKTKRMFRDINPQKDFPLQELNSFLDYKKSVNPGIKNNWDDTDDSDKFYYRQCKKIDFIRFHRKYKVAIYLCIAAFISLIFIIRASFLSYMENYTSMGLDSVQTIQSYYKGVNQKDTVLLDKFTKGRATRDYNDVISNIFVISKMRQTSNIDSGFLSPGRWLFEAASRDSFEKASLYGITNLTIDGKPYSVNIDVPKIKDLYNPLEIEPKTKVTHKISYNLIHNVNDSFELTNEEISGTIELTFTIDRWRITNFNTESNTKLINKEQFKSDYLSALEETNMNVYQAVEFLKTDYPWLPDEKEISAGIEEIKERTEYINQFSGIQ